MDKKERRYFNRYGHRSRCVVRAGSKSFVGETVDYSNGLCAVFPNSPELIKGAKVHVKVLYPEMDFKAEVIWVDEKGDELTAGFKRLDSFQGSLQHYALPDVLNGLQVTKASGVLKIESGSNVKGILIKDGFLINAYSNSKDDRLCEIFLREKKISQEKYELVNTYLKENDEKEENVLFDFGILKPTELNEAVKHQVEEIVISLFALEGGSFIFLEGSPTTKKLLPVRISIAQVIYQGIKRLWSIDQVRQAIPDRGAVLDISQNADIILSHLKIEDAERKILSKIDGQLSLDSILQLSDFEEADTLRSLCAFLRLRLVSVKEGVEASAEAGVGEAISSPDEEQAKAEQAKAEKAKAEQAKAEKAKAEKAKAEKAKAEQAKAEQAKAEQAKAEQAKAEQAKAEQAKAEQAKAEQAKAEQAKAEQAKAEQAKAEQAKAEQAKAEKAKAEKAKAEKAKAEKAKAEKAKAEKAKAEKAKAEKAKAEKAAEAAERETEPVSNIYLTSEDKDGEDLEKAAQPETAGIIAEDVVSGEGEKSEE